LTLLQNSQIQPRHSVQYDEKMRCSALLIFSLIMEASNRRTRNDADSGVFLTIQLFSANYDTSEIIV